MSIFIGRERELGELRAALDATFAADGRFILIAGEPGIGKTTLANELARDAMQRGARVLRGGNFEGGGAPPYWPWIQVLRGCRAESASPPAALDLAELLPESPPLAEHLEPDLARFRLFDGVAALLHAECATRPLVVLLDDLQWADESSLLLLQFLGRDLGGSRLLLLGAYRGVEANRRPEIRRHLDALACAARTLVLGGLAEPEVAALIAHTTDRHCAPPLAAAVHGATAGNPLFVDELVRALIAENLLDARLPAARLPLPERVRALIRRRLSDLSEPCRRALAAAAVIGRELDLAVLAHACGESADGALAAIDEARAAEIIAGSGGRFAFAHDLFREVLYDDLGPEERRRLHGAVASAIERLDPADTGQHLSELAHHFFQAAPGSEPAIRYSMQAADRAARQLGFEEAAAHCQTALEALAACPAPDPVRRCEILLALGANLWKTGEIERAREVHAEAADLAEALGLPEAQARAALGYGSHDVSFDRANVEPRLVQLLERALAALGPEDSVLRASLMARIGAAVQFSPPDRPRGEALARAAVAMARPLADPQALHFILCCFVCATWGPDNLEERLAISGEIARLSAELGAVGMAEVHVSLVAHLDEAGDAAGAQREAEMYGLRTRIARRPVTTWILTVRQAMAALARGRLDEAEALSAQALQIRDPSRDPNAAQYFGAQLFVLRREQGRLDEVVDGIAAFATDNPALPIWRAAVAWIYAELGRNADAERELERLGADDFSDIPRDMYWLPCLWVLAEVVSRLGDRRRADTLYTLLRPYRSRSAIVPMAFNGGSLERSLGLLAATAASRTDEAAEHFEAALVANQRIGARLWVAHTEHEYARLLLARGRPADRPRALELLDRALDTARALGMAALQAQAESLRAEAGPLTEAEALFRREGEYWTVGYDGRTMRVRDARGLHLISLLLCAPGRDIAAADLAVWPEWPVHGGRSGRDLARELGLSVSSTSDSAEPDVRARAEYRARLEALRDEAEEAERFNDPWRAGRAREEMAAIAEQLGAHAADGQLRRDSERARLAVTKAIRYAIRKVERAHPPLGHILATTVKTGTFCRYEPDRRRPVRWTF